MLKQLNGLVLDDNPDLELKTILNNLGKLQNLKVLLLRNNSFGSLPENLESLSGLQVLELSNNTFSEKEKKRIVQALPTTKVIFKK